MRGVDGYLVGSPADGEYGSRILGLIESDSPMRLQLLGVKLRDGINMDLFCDD